MQHPESHNVCVSENSYSFSPLCYIPPADIIKELGIGRILVAPQLSAVQAESTLPELQHNMHLQQPPNNSQPH